jgi:hypothetical protein
MPLRPVALATTMLAASLASGMGFIARGYGGDLGFDGTVIDALDALLLWLMISFVPLGVVTIFAFLPLIAVLDRLGSRDFLTFLSAGVAAGTVPVLPFLGLVDYADMLALFILPGAVAGLTWWWMAIERDAATSSSF